MKFLMQYLALVLAICTSNSVQATYVFPICGPLGTAFEDGIRFIQDRVRLVIDYLFKQETKEEPISLLQWLVALGTGVEEKSDYLSDARILCSNVYNRLSENIAVVIIISGFICYAFVSRTYFDYSMRPPQLETEEEPTGDSSCYKSEESESDFETTCEPNQCKKCACVTTLITEYGDGVLQ